MNTARRRRTACVAHAPVATVTVQVMRGPAAWRARACDPRRDPATRPATPRRGPTAPARQSTGQLFLSL